MRRFPQGVTIVTAQTRDGPVGLTVSSFTSVSLEPPLVLVSLGKGTEVHEGLLGAKHFAVNVLAADQKRLSERFAGMAEMAERFDGVAYSKGIGGSPLIEGAVARIETKVWRRYDGGDHTLLLGEVVRASTAGSASPLVYVSQKYATVGPLRAEGAR
jgi:flavin reductase (DIM6/NTAB) family NADH-FMN oxidoreductase RutF